MTEAEPTRKSPQFREINLQPELPIPQVWQSLDTLFSTQLPPDFQYTGRVIHSGNPTSFSNQHGPQMISLYGDEACPQFFLYSTDKEWYERYHREICSRDMVYGERKPEHVDYLTKMRLKKIDPIMSLLASFSGQYEDQNTRIKGIKPPRVTSKICQDFLYGTYIQIYELYGKVVVKETVNSTAKMDGLTPEDIAYLHDITTDTLGEQNRIKRYPLIRTALIRISYNLWSSDTALKQHMK